MARETLRLKPKRPEPSIPASVSVELREYLLGLGDLLDDDRFVAVVRRLLGSGFAGIYDITYSGTAQAASYAEGKRALGLMLLDECRRARPDVMELLAKAPLVWVPPTAADQPNGDAE